MSSVPRASLLRCGALAAALTFALAAGATAQADAATLSWSFDETTSGNDINWSSPTAVDTGASEYNTVFQITDILVNVTFIGIPVNNVSVIDQVPPEQQLVEMPVAGPAPVTFSSTALVFPEPPEAPSIAGNLDVGIDAGGFGFVAFTDVVLGTATVDLGIFGVQTVQIEAVRVIGTLDIAATWYDLGFSLAGAGGAPVLAGTGTLAAGDPVTISLTGAAPSAPAFLFVGFSRIDFPFFYGGTLVPDPTGLLLILSTDATGNVVLPGSWPANVPSRFSSFMQVWVEDAGGPFGYAATNAIEGVTP